MPSLPLCFAFCQRRCHAVCLVSDGGRQIQCLLLSLPLLLLLYTPVVGRKRGQCFLCPLPLSSKILQGNRRADALQY